MVYPDFLSLSPSGNRVAGAHYSLGYESRIRSSEFLTYKIHELEEWNSILIVGQPTKNRASNNKRPHHHVCEFVKLNPIEVGPT